MSVQIEAGYCQCGCGQKTSLWPQSHKKLGVTKGQPRRFVQGHYQAQKKPTNYATCHPDRPVKARGLCGSCYNESLLIASPEKRERKRARQNERWAERYAARNSAEHAKVQKERHLRHRYGIGMDEYQRMHDDQENRCAICGGVGGDTRSTRLHVDHDHRTGAVRKLLCARCNASVGALEQNSERMVELVAYLHMHDKDNPVWKNFLAVLDLQQRDLAHDD